MASNQPLAIEYHGKASGTGHWRKGQELIDALAYVDPITDDVRAKVNKLIEEEMRRSTKKPADYLKEMPPVPPAKFEGHPMLKEEYERVRAFQPMQPLDVTRYRLDPPPQNKRNDQAAWAAAANNAHAQLEHQLNRITNLELLLKYGANSWRAQTQLDEALLKQLEGTLQGLRKSIDQLNRERKLQQQAAGAELRTLEDRYYTALRKNLEIDAACQSIEEEMQLLEAKIGKLDKQQQQQQPPPAADGQTADGPSPAAEPAAAAAAAAEDGPVANGTAAAEGPQPQQQEQQDGPQQQQQEQQQEQAADVGPTPMES